MKGPALVRRADSGCSGTCYDRVVEVSMEELNEIEVQERFGGQFVARRGGEVVASAETYDELMLRLDEMKPEWDSLVIEFVEPADSVRVY